MSDRLVAHYRWVLAQHQPNTEQGKKVLAAALKRSHYILINPQRAKTDPIIVAFKYVGETLPEHLTPASPAQAERLEKISGN